MSAARRLALVAIVVLVTAAMSAASVLAQVGTPNPSGGTCVHPAIEGGAGSAALGRFLSSGPTLDLGLRSWLTNYVVSRMIASPSARPVSGHTMTAVVTRRPWGR